MSEVEATARPITADEVERALAQIEALSRELADQLRWARERGFCVGDGLEAVDRFVDDQVYLPDGITGSYVSDGGDVRYVKCTCTDTTPCGLYDQPHDPAPRRAAG